MYLAGNQEAKPVTSTRQRFGLLGAKSHMGEAGTLARVYPQQRETVRAIRRNQFGRSGASLFGLLGASVRAIRRINSRFPPEVQRVVQQLTS